jgi:hypothetical protein
MIRERARVSSGTARVQFARAGYRWSVSAGGQTVAGGQTALEDAPYGVTVRALAAGTDGDVAFDGYGKNDVKLKLTLGAGDYRQDYTLTQTDGVAILEPVRPATLGED